MSQPAVPAFRRLVASQINSASDALRRSHSLRLRREFDLSHVEWRTICLIEFMQPVRLRDVAAESMADKAQISRIVSALVRRGIVARQEFIGDARSARLELTTEGTALAVKLSMLGEERERMLRDALGADVEPLLRALATVKGKAAQMAEAEERLAPRPVAITAMAEPQIGPILTQ
jgi:DNA-binding MarR family transcriptional regulator